PPAPRPAWQKPLHRADLCDRWNDLARAERGWYSTALAFSSTNRPDQAGGPDKMRRLLGLAPLVAALALLAVSSRAVSQPDFLPKTQPQTKALPGGIVPAATGAPVNPFPLTRDAGAWLICAAHYTGPDGMELARQVAVDLRDRHRLP